MKADNLKCRSDSTGHRLNSQSGAIIVTGIGKRQEANDLLALSNQSNTKGWITWQKMISMWCLLMVAGQ